jgi:ABC-type transporter Mla subunit MlaD
MFTTDSIIDAVQNSQKNMVKMFVKGDELAATVNGLIDQQADYTRKTANAATEMFSTLTQETTNAVQSALRFNYTKLGEDMLKAYVPVAPATTAKKSK